MSNSYRELLVWQRAKALAVMLYSNTERFPRTETFGLVSQMRRAGVSVASNIAEGQGRLTRGEFRHFLGLARGSLLELQTQVAIAVDLRYLSSAEGELLNMRIEEELYLLNRLISSLTPQQEPKSSETSETFETSETPSR